jgi:hypothetical protein
VNSDAGLVLVWELQERLGLGELIEEHRVDSRIAQSGMTRSSRWATCLGNRSTAVWQAAGDG